MMKLIASKTFKAQLVREYSSTPVLEQLGEYNNEMNLWVSDDGKSGFIEWLYEQDGEEDCTEMGVWFEGKTVTDYDGVFSLPEQAIELLKEQGYDCSEVE